MTRSLNRELLRLALPNILSNLTVPMVGLVDIALAGHMSSAAHGPEVYIGTVGLASIIFSYLYWGFGFLRMGTTGMAAQAFGREDDPQLMHILSRGLVVALGGGVLVMALQWPIGQLSIWLVDAEPAVERLTLGYFNIRIYAAPATLSLYALNGWFLGMQNSRFALYTTAAVNLLNVGLSIALVEVAGMRTEGIALGTALAQWGGLGIGALLFFGRYIHLVRLRSWSATISAPELKAFFSVNADIFLRTVGLLTIFALFVGKSAELGTLTLASNRLLLELKTLAAFAIDGFAFAAESLTGRFAGARQRSRLFASLKLSFAWGGGLGLAFAAVFWLVPGWILGFFTEETSIIEKALDYLPWVVVYVAVSSAAFVWDGVFVGLTASRAMRNSMIVALFIGFLPAFYIAPLHLGNHGLWLAMLLSVVARGAAQTAMAPGLLPR